jgi:hypothetical protein
VSLSGRRAQILLNPAADFALAVRLRSPQGAPLGETFSFISGLYFRGKMSYALTFGSARGGLPSAFVMSAGGGLCQLEERVTPARLRDWARTSIDDKNPHFTAPLLRQSAELLEQHEADASFVLLGSVASNKYVRPLLEVFEERLLFPAQFVGMGDMSRGALLLRAAQEGVELPYAPVAGSIRSSARSGERA